MSSKCLLLLPLSVSLVLSSTIIASYIVGVVQKHGDLHYIPYPSDLGISQPEKGIFSTGLCLSAGLNFVVIFIRFVQVDGFYPRVYSFLNVASLIAGILMLVGQCIVPAFTLKEDRITHYVGASMFFGFACIYMIMQAVISHKHVFNHTSILINFRIGCSVCGCLCLLAYALARGFAPKEKHRYRIPHVSEWILALVLVLFTASFVWDFKRIRIRMNSYEISARSRAANSLYSNKEDERECVM